RRDDVRRLARRRAFPELLVARDAQRRDRITDQARLWLRAAAGRALVADLAAGAGRGAGKGRDGGRVVVRLDLHHGVGLARMPRIDAVGPRVEALGAAAFHDRRIVGVGDYRALRAHRVRVADHG